MNGDDRAWETLVRLTEDSIKLQTEHNLLLRGLSEKLEDVSDTHTRSVAETRTYMKGVIETTLASSERWWRRAFVVLGLVVAFATAVGAALDRLMAMTH